MANDLATLRGKLDVQLGDTAHEAWDQTEKEDLITWAVRGLYPRRARNMEKPIWPLDPETEDYAVPTGMREVNRVEWAEVATDHLVVRLPGDVWYVYGDPMADSLTLWVSRDYTSADYYLILHGYGVHDFTTNQIPDDYVPLVLAKARAEAYRRMAADRARFEQWLSSNQTQNMSVNELLQLIQDADDQAARLDRMLPRTQRLPVPGRQ